MSSDKYIYIERHVFLEMEREIHGLIADNRGLSEFSMVPTGDLVKNPSWTYTILVRRNERYESSGIPPASNPCPRRESLSTIHPRHDELIPCFLLPATLSGGSRDHRRGKRQRGSTVVEGFDSRKRVRRGNLHVSNEQVDGGGGDSDRDCSGVDHEGEDEEEEEEEEEVGGEREEREGKGESEFTTLVEGEETLYLLTKELRGLLTDDISDSPSVLIEKGGRLTLRSRPSSYVVSTPAFEEGEEVDDQATDPPGNREDDGRDGRRWILSEGDYNPIRGRRKEKRKPSIY